MAARGWRGIPVIVWASLRRWSKDDQRAVFQPVVVAVFVMTLIWFGGTGIVTPETLRLFWIGLPAAVIGTWLGLKLYGKLDEATFRVVVLVLLLASGLTLLPWPWSKRWMTEHGPYLSRRTVLAGLGAATVLPERRLGRATAPTEASESSRSLS